MWWRTMHHAHPSPGLTAAVIDVTESESLPAESELWEMSQVTIAGGQAMPSTRSRNRASRSAIVFVKRQAMPDAVL